MRTGILHWGRKTVVKSSMESWYDVTNYRVPVTGRVDVAKISTVLQKTYYPPHHNVFGGYCSLGAVTDNGDNTVNVEVLYHIGE